MAPPKAAAMAHTAGSKLFSVDLALDNIGQLGFELLERRVIYSCAAGSVAKIVLNKSLPV